MSRISNDSSPDAPRVIVVERRSILSQIGGVWFVAMPIVVAVGICRVPYEVPETPVAELRLGRDDWFLSRPPAKVGVNGSAPTGSEAAAESLKKSVDSAVKEPEIMSAVPVKPVESQTPQAPMADPVPGLPQGVVVSDSPRSGVNPVAVFDPEGKAAEEAAEPENRTLTAALNFDGGPPTDVETKQALEEIRKAADVAKVERERLEAIKPLVAVHEQAQAERREVQRQEALRRRAVDSRAEFVKGLVEILGSGMSITQKGRQIDLLIRRDSENADMAVYQNFINKLDSSRRPMSRAAKLRAMRDGGVPESIILSYLIRLDMQDIRKATGPRDQEDAIVRSARILMNTMKSR